MRMPPERLKLSPCSGSGRTWSLAGSGKNAVFRRSFNHCSKLAATTLMLSGPSISRCCIGFLPVAAIEPLNVGEKTISFRGPKRLISTTSTEPLGQEIKSKGQKTLGTPRRLKDLIEEELFERRRDLFTEVDLVFFDTTSLYFEGCGGESIGKRGHTKDHRPDLYQMVVGMALDVEGRPICCEMWPGNTADVKTLTPIVKRMRERFRLREITVVADRGMVSQATLEAFEKSDPPVRYIVGVRMRRQKEVNTSVLGSRARWFESIPERTTAKDLAPLKVKEVWVKERRYIVCLNEEERRKDAHDRAAIVAHLEEQLRNGDKSWSATKAIVVISKWKEAAT